MFTTYCRVCKQSTVSVKERPKPLSPAIISLLETNQTPSEPESHLLADAISERTLLLRELDTEISYLSAKLTALQELREVRAEEIRSLRAVGCPIRMFPAEILREIFAICTSNMAVDMMGREMDVERVYQYSDSTKPSPRDPWRTPWTLAAVCSRWRYIAISFAELWSFVSCVYRQPLKNMRSDNHMADPRYTRISLHLSRSLPYPLSFLGKLEDHISELISISSRLEHLYLWISDTWNTAAHLETSVRTLRRVGPLDYDSHAHLPPIPKHEHWVTFPRILSLSLSYPVTSDPIDTSSSVFTLIATPSIVSIKIVKCHLQYEVSCISEFFQRSSCPLETLELYDASKDMDANYLPIIHALPATTMRQMTLQLPDRGHAQILAQLTQRPDLLPGLVSLVLYGERPSQMDRLLFLRSARPALDVRVIKKSRYG